MAANDFLANIGRSLLRSTMQRVIGVAVLVIVGGIFAGVKMMANGHADTNAQPAAVANANPQPAAPAAGEAPAAPNAANNANANAAAAPARNANHVAANASNAAANANANAAQAAPAVRNAASAGSGAPVVSPVSQHVAGASTNGMHLDDHLTYQYNALGRRDPFTSLVDGQFVGADVGGDAPPDPGGIKVVGIVWGATDQFALVEDVRGNSFVLRKGDKLQNGVVEGLKRDGVIVNITAEGQSQTVVIPLVRKGDQNVR